MAVVDITTGKIIGAARGTKSWYHEKGHLVFNKSSKGILLSYNRDSSLILAIILMIVGDFFNWITIKFLALTAVTMFVGLYFYEEVWCWVYAFKKYKKGSEKIQKKNRRQNAHKKIYL